MKNVIYKKHYNQLGELSIRSFQLDKDCEFLHQWVNKEYAVFWGMQNTSLEDVQEEYEVLQKRKNYNVFVGEFNQVPCFLFERYNPLDDPISSYYKANKTDAGVHIIVAPPPKDKIPNFTWYIFNCIMEFVFDSTQANRIVIEPDLRNKKMFALCQRIGFNLSEIIELSNKTAQLAFLQKEDFKSIQSQNIITKRSAMNTINNIVSPSQAIDYMTPENWQIVNKQLIKKAISEFYHEQLIKSEHPVPLSDNWFLHTFYSDDISIKYLVRAKTMRLQHLWIDESSILKIVNDHEQVLDAVQFIKEFRIQLGISQNNLPTYLEEILSTLQGSLYKRSKGNPTSSELVHSDFQTIEQSMSEGHPCFIANNGRIGFDSSDYQSYSPEAGNSFSLLWLAGHKSKTSYAGTKALNYETLLKQELSESTIHRFNQTICDKKLNPDDYLFIPIHPWQWFNKLAIVFSSEVANENLICLGYSEDQYLAQQSIRTMYNTSSPKKFYVKSALSILNMGFMRGLPQYYLGTAPIMAEWLEKLLYNDQFLQNSNFKMLSEVASISYVNNYFEEFGCHNDYNKMLASLWRESPTASLADNEQVMTMAAFLHIDQDGTALLPLVIKASELTIDDWLTSYFNTYLIPLLHCFYQYDLVFMPHGENCILTLKNSIPKSLFLKDITEEAVFLSKEIELPKELQRMYVEVPEDVKLLSVFTDIFDDYFRFMIQILQEHANYSENQFWSVLADSIHKYQSEFPALKNKFETYNLFAKEFQLSCLNRLQLNNNKQMIDLDDPVALLQFSGTLQNPLAEYDKSAINSLQLN